MAAAATSLAASRRQGDGARRVSYQETRMTSSRLYDSDEDDDEIEERMRQEEEAEEQALSERFGEAEEGPSGDGNNKRKKEESEKDIAQELDKEEQKKIKKVRPQLLPSNLTDHNGLIKLPIEFKRIKYKPKKGKKRDISAAAAYCNNLVNAYYSFCNDLFPSMNFEDVLLKIEQLGSKKEVKDYLQNMRNATRNEYLESLYGREKAERMLQELNDGLKLHDRDDVELDMHMHSPMPDKTSVEDTNNVGNAESPTLEGKNNSPESPHYSGNKNTTTATSPPLQTKESDLEEQSDAEQEATFDEDESSPTTEVPMQIEPVSEPQQEEASIKMSPTCEAEEDEDDDDDDDEEEEASFDDVMEVDNATQRTPSLSETRIATDHDDTATSQVLEIENEASAANETVTNKDKNEGVESTEQLMELDVQENMPSKGDTVGDVDPSGGNEDASPTGGRNKEGVESNEKDVSKDGLDQVENDKHSEVDQDGRLDIAEQKVAEAGSTVVEDGVHE